VEARPHQQGLVPRVSVCVRLLYFCAHANHVYGGVARAVVAGHAGALGVGYSGVRHLLLRSVRVCYGAPRGELNVHHWRISQCIAVHLS